MKVLIYIFLALAAGLLIFNLFYIDFEEPLEGESFAAVVGVGAVSYTHLTLPTKRIV